MKIQLFYDIEVFPIHTTTQNVKRRKATWTSRTNTQFWTQQASWRALITKRVELYELLSLVIITRLFLSLIYSRMHNNLRTRRDTKKKLQVVHVNSALLWNRKITERGNNAEAIELAWHVWIKYLPRIFPNVGRQGNISIKAINAIHFEEI